MRMNTSAPLYVRTDSSGQLQLLGDWSLRHYEALQSNLRSISDKQGAWSLDFSELKSLDTTGAQVLCEWLGAERVQTALDSAQGLSKERHQLLQTVAKAMSRMEQEHLKTARWGITDLFERVGLAMVHITRNVRELLGFIGLTLETLLLNMLRPSQWRVTSIVAQLEETAFNAVPIVALLTFLVGAVIAFLGATVLADFGATIYTVNLVGFSFLREFAVLLTAILMAGRTASAFTAQIGSMKANEEIDALRAQGLNPMLILVIPRVLAMLLAMPILTFVGMVAGIFGGGLVCALILDISPTMFINIFNQDIDLRHFVLGMSKAPIFAFLIAVIGCQEGFKVTGSAQSVGEHTTSAVVQSIFIVILIDALAALFFMEMGW
ncbi:MAG: ABC transporter permease [Alcaligenes sp.]